MSDWVITPTEQTKFGKPDGNCFAACLATIFNKKIEDVPEFHKISGESSWWYHFLEWARGLGYEVLTVWPGAIRELPKNVPYIANGAASRGLLHSVVFMNGTMIHDPHPSGEGLICYDDYYFFVRSHAPQIGVDKVAEKMWDEHKYKHDGGDYNNSWVTVEFESQEELAAALRKAMEAK